MNFNPEVKSTPQIPEEKHNPLEDSKSTFDKLFSDDLSESKDVNGKDYGENIINGDEVFSSMFSDDFEVPGSAGDYDTIGLEPGELYPKYQRIMEEEGYSSVEEMCNDLALNYDDVYVDESDFAEDDEDAESVDEANIGENTPSIDDKDTIDLTKQYEPNSKIEVDGKTYETDDNGTIYKIDGYELLPNIEYTIDGVKYKTDDQGRIVSCDGQAKSTPDGERDLKAQNMAGGEDRKPGDQGGHILARIFGGAKGIENMLAMRGTAINQSVYKRMENEIAKALDDGKEVDVHVDVEYEGDSKRPSKITVKYTIEGKETIVQFDNDEGSTDLVEPLEGKIENADLIDLKQEIQDANEDGANISLVSVKAEYDTEGNIVKVTVTIRDDNSEHPVNEERVYTPKEDA